MSRRLRHDFVSTSFAELADGQKKSPLSKPLLILGQLYRAIFGPSQGHLGSSLGCLGAVLGHLRNSTSLWEKRGRERKLHRSLTKMINYD